MAGRRARSRSVDARPGKDYDPPMTPAARQEVSYADYLAAESASPVKHEFLRGEVWAMAGGTPEHGRLAANIIHEIRKGLGARPCVVYTSDVRVRIEATDRSTYPDVTVVCGKVETAADDPDAVTNPVVLVEVLSKDTEADDRGEKFAHYRHLTSLREYLLVAQRARRLELYRREGERWVLSEAAPGGTITLESVGVVLDVDAVYHDPMEGG